MAATRKAAPNDAARRRERVESVRKASKRLTKVEAGLQDALARLPGLVREVGEIRATLERATVPDQEEAK